MSIFYLPKNASKARLREAENARKNRAEILKAYSQGKVSRRELIKWGLITTGGVIAPIGGLSPFVAYASGGSGSGGVVQAAAGLELPAASPRECLPVRSLAYRLSLRRCRALMWSRATMSLRSLRRRLRRRIRPSSR